MVPRVVHLSPILPLLGVLWFGGCANDPGVTERLVGENTVLDTNLILGVHAIGGPYQLTDEPYLIEVARELEAMGSGIIKFNASPRYTKRPYFLEPVPGIDSIATLLDRHPVFREVLSMGFRDYFFWATPLGDVRWGDGLSDAESKRLFDEFHELTRYLLTEFNNTGKHFHLGHWEGDWLLIPNQNPKLDPSPTRIQGMIDYLNVRQAAVEKARKTTPHSNVAVYHYTEVNLVMKGLDGSRPTLTNAVLPHVDVDFVSYSSYDTIQGDNMRERVFQALDHIESRMKPRPDWPGKRVYAGEFAIRASLVDFDPAEHDRRNREVIAAFLEWGCPYILYWQMYCNEVREDLEQGYNGFWLVDPEGTKYSLYHTLDNYWTEARNYIAATKASRGSDPTDEEMHAFALNFFIETPIDP